MNSSSYKALRCTICYPWHRVRKCWLSMLSSLNHFCVIDSRLTRNFQLVKEVNVRDNRNCLQNIKASTQNMLNPFDWIFFFLNSQNNYFSSLHEKVSVERLIARNRYYFHKKNYRSLCKSNWSVTPISICWTHLNKQLWRKKGVALLHFSLVFYFT